MQQISRSLIVELQIQNMIRAIMYCGEYSEDQQTKLIEGIKRLFDEVQNG